MNLPSFYATKKTHYLCCYFVLILSITSNLSAQSTKKIIEGVVTDQQGMPLPGASILVKGTSIGTMTNFDGEFKLEIANPSPTLIITYIGFKKKEVAIKDNDYLKIILKENTSALSEIVITALGIKREQKKLGFSQETVESDQLSRVTPNNWSSGLKGKVAGLNIVSAGSGPINSQKIKLRGNNSLNPNGNNALIVVDGVPINSQMTASGSATAYMGGRFPCRLWERHFRAQCLEY